MLVHALGMWLCSLNVGHLMSVKVFFISICNHHLNLPLPIRLNQFFSLYLNTKERESTCTDWQRDQAEKDVQQVRTGNVLASQESALSR